jgi:cytoskeletal protein RodZ
VIAAALGLGFGASAFLNVAQFQRADQERKLMQGEITDLRYQVDQDKKNGTADAATPSPSPSGSPTPSPSASPQVEAASTTTKSATVKTPLNVHADASKSSAVKLSYTSLPAGATVTLGSDVRNGYQQITYNGVTGYIDASALTY